TTTAYGPRCSGRPWTGRTGRAGLGEATENEATANEATGTRPPETRLRERINDHGEPDQRNGRRGRLPPDPRDHLPGEDDPPAPPGAQPAGRGRPGQRGARRS